MYPCEQVDVSPESFSEAYRDVSSIGVEAAPNVLGVLSNYLPQAMSTEKQLARAIAQVCCQGLLWLHLDAQRVSWSARAYVGRCWVHPESYLAPRMPSNRRVALRCCLLFESRVAVLPFLRSDENARQRKYGKRASNAYSRASVARRAADEEHHSQFQYKLKLNDAFDARAQRPLRRFVQDEQEEEEECPEGQECEGREQGGGKEGEEGGDWHVVVDENTHQPVEEAPVLSCGEGEHKEEGTAGKLDRYVLPCSFASRAFTPIYANQCLALRGMCLLSEAAVHIECHACLHPTPSCDCRCCCRHRCCYYNYYTVDSHSCLARGGGVVVIC